MKRTMITRMVMAIIGEVMDKQDEKGVRKYGQTLDVVPLSAYDWNEMAMEEMVDCMKYLMMENGRLTMMIRDLKDQNERLRRR